MKVKLNPAVVAALDKMNASIEINQQVFGPQPSSSFSIEKNSISLEHENMKLEADYYLFPERNQAAADTQNQRANFLVLSFLRLSRLQAHTWQEISCKYFVFTWPSPGESTLDSRPISVLHPGSQMIN